MGGKRLFIGNKRIIYIACCLGIFFCISSCKQISYKGIQDRLAIGSRGYQHLCAAELFITTHDYPAALKENKKAYENLPDGLKQKATFQKGLIFADPNNRDKNYKKALDYFTRVKDVKVSRREDFRASAAVISSLLNMMIGSEKKYRDQGLRLTEKNRQLTLLENEILELRKQIEKFKEIDLKM